MTKTLYNVLPLARMLRESTYAKLSNVMSVYAGFPISVHGDKTSGLCLSYNSGLFNASFPKSKTDDELKAALVAIFNDKKPIVQNPLLQRAMASLLVFTLTPATLAFLTEHDPMALKQANEVLDALKEAGVCSNCRP